MSEIILTFKYTMQNPEIKRRVAWRYPEMKAKAGRRIFHLPQLLIWFCSLLCGERLCPLGATISPSNSFQPGIRAAFPVPFPSFSMPGLLQRDRQLVRLGEVSFDVPDSAEAALFAHIKTGEIQQLSQRKRQADTTAQGCWPVCHVPSGPWTWSLRGGRFLPN